MTPKNRQHVARIRSRSGNPSTLAVAGIWSKFAARRRLKILALLMGSILSTSAEPQSRTHKQVDNYSNDRVSTNPSEKSSPSSDGRTQQVVNQGISVGLSV